jgi:hypothetical protein
MNNYNDCHVAFDTLKSKYDALVSSKRQLKVTLENAKSKATVDKQQLQFALDKLTNGEDIEKIKAAREKAEKDLGTANEKLTVALGESKEKKQSNTTLKLDNTTLASNLKACEKENKKQATEITNLKLALTKAVDDKDEKQRSHEEKMQNLDLEKARVQAGGKRNNLQAQMDVARTRTEEVLKVAEGKDQIKQKSKDASHNAKNERGMQLRSVSTVGPVASYSFSA